MTRTTQGRIQYGNGTAIHGGGFVWGGRQTARVRYRPGPSL
ncbi:hypothetical protein [Lysobacter gummosus]